MKRLTTGDMTYLTLADKVKHLLGFWQMPCYNFFTGEYLGYEWHWLGWDWSSIGCPHKRIKK